MQQLDTQYPMVAAIQSNSSDDVRTNVEKAMSRIGEAASGGAQVVCLQELFAGPYPCQTEDHRNFDLAETIPAPTTQALSQAARQHDIVIVSSSGAEVVEPIGQMLGADHIVATRMVIDDGKYTGEISYYAYGPTKADAIRDMAADHGYDLSESYAYSDSHSDLPMLSAVGHPVAVNPDGKLERHARAHTWPVVVFSERTKTVIRRMMAGTLSTALAAGTFVAGLEVGSRRRPAHLVTRLVQADGPHCHRRPEQHFARVRLLHQNADVHRPGAQRRRRREHTDPHRATALGQPQHPAVPPGG